MKGWRGDGYGHHKYLGEGKSQNTNLWPPGNTRGEGKRMTGEGRASLYNDLEW